MPTVLVCPDRFKGTCAAPAVAAAIAAALPTAVAVDRCPLSDGGAGFLDAMLAAGPEGPEGPGGLRVVACRVTGPRGAPVDARYAVHHAAGYAVVEMAAAAGLELLPRGGGHPDPAAATSCGVGELLRRAAAEPGVAEVLLGTGGSATNDAAVGALQRLGAALALDGAPVAADGPPLTGGDMARVTFPGPTPPTAELRRAQCFPTGGGGGGGGGGGTTPPRLVVVCDVDNPMTGPAGASAVYGPQKGASPAAVAAMDGAMAALELRLAAAVGAPSVAALPGSGSGGGAVGALRAYLGAAVRPGAAFVADRVGLAARVAAADLVVTGEGCLDRGTVAHGKTVAHVAAVAAAHGKPVVVVCGRCDVTAAELPAGVVAVLSLSEDHGAARATADTVECLAATAARLPQYLPSFCLP